MEVKFPKLRKKMTLAIITMAAQTWLFANGQISAEEFAAGMTVVSGLFSVGQGIADKGKEGAK